MENMETLHKKTISNKNINLTQEGIQEHNSGDNIHLIQENIPNNDIDVTEKGVIANNANKTYENSSLQRKRNRIPLMLRRLQSYNKDPRQLRKRQKNKYF